MLRYEMLRWAGISIPALWLVWMLVWIAAARTAKPIVQQVPAQSRMPYRLLSALSLILFLLARGTRLGRALQEAGPAGAWLYIRFIRLYPGVVLIGAPLVAIGLALAVWARFYLGGNWSSAVTFKQDHELIRSGPYRLVRHPIYTGILLAVAGSACAIGQMRGIVAFVLVFIGLWYKSRLEERLMIEHFGDAYRHYRTEVRALVPYLF
jgi:protein-S-isoprenylcysteine O-methyltransferase Ste14